MTSFLTNSVNSATRRAVHHQECPYCYEPLTSKLTAYLFDKHDQLVCYHSFHCECLEKELSETTLPNPLCLLCSKEFFSIKPAPRVDTDSKKFFQYFDTNKDDRLSYQELIDGLKGMLDLDFAQIEIDIDSLFGQWDKDGNGYITYDEFIDRQNGLLAYLMHHFPKGPMPPPPDLLEAPLDWFNYWDEDKSNSLDKSEITRALIKTFKIYNLDRSVITQIVDKVWPLFDLDNSGVIEVEEFVAPDNLGDTIAAQIVLEERGPEALREAFVENIEEEDDEDNEDEINGEISEQITA